MAMTKEELQRPENWDFGWITKKGAYPGEILRECFYYEIGRHIPHFIRDVTWEITQEKGAHKIITATLHDSECENEISGSLASMVFSAWQLPKSPIRMSGHSLVVPAAYPSLSYRAFEEGRRTKNEGAELMEWLEMLAPVNSFEAYLHFSGNGDAYSDPEKASDEIVLFSIPRNAPKTALLDAFERFLDSRSAGHYQPQKGSGKDLHKTHKGLLNKLGAWRLLLSGLTSAEAEDYSQEWSDGNRPIYGNPSDWTVAKKTIDDILRKRFNAPDPI